MIYASGVANPIYRHYTIDVPSSCGRPGLRSLDGSRTAVAACRFGEPGLTRRTRNVRKIPFLGGVTVKGGDGIERSRPPRLRISEYDIGVNRTAITVAAVVAFAFACGCSDDRSTESRAEANLNPQQASGHAIFQQICAPCHDAHSVPGENGPNLKGLFKKTFLPSGLPANDRFVRQTVLHGRNMMPAAGSNLGEQQVDDLLAYLHTL
jgi:mono/diheme cytochrome c family protein